VEKRDLVLVDNMPASDAAYPIVMAILAVVPTSRWAFARPQGGGLAQLLASHENGDELVNLTSENIRQREKSKTGSRIAATLGPLGEYESGITLLFADARSNFGILTLLRTKALGPFTSAEIAMLTLALDAGSERLAALRLNPSAISRSIADHRASAVNPLRNPQGEEYVLDRDLHIVMTWSAQDQRRAALTGMSTQLADRLPAILEDTVRELTAGWQRDPATHLPGVARPVPFLVVRTQPVAGPAGLCIGVRIDRFEPENSLVGPALRFHITPRELEVLALLLDGAKLDEIAGALNITASTVQDHIKSMVEKSESRNRTELIARVLGWEKSAEAP
jgi:DNA-binding CsgD family transcriptional regulator